MIIQVIGFSILPVMFFGLGYGVLTGIALVLANIVENFMNGEE